MFDRKKTALMTLEVTGTKVPMVQYPKVLRKYRRYRRFPWLIGKKGWKDLQNYMSPEGGEPTEEDFRVGWFWEDQKKREKEIKKLETLYTEWGRKSPGCSFSVYVFRKDYRLGLGLI